MDESSKNPHNCSLLQILDGMIKEFVAEFGREPSSICLGMTVAEHLWDHVRAAGVSGTIEGEPNLVFNNVPIKVVGLEDACFLEIELGQVVQFRDLMRRQQEMAREAHRKLLKETDTSHH